MTYMYKCHSGLGSEAIGLGFRDTTDPPRLNSPASSGERNISVARFGHHTVKDEVVPGGISIESEEQFQIAKYFRKIVIGHQIIPSPFLLPIKRNSYIFPHDT